MIITTKGPQNIGQVKTHFIHGNLFLSPEEYQRENAWGFSQKQLLIDTIFKGLDIPKFYLWKIDMRVLADGYPESEAKQLYKKILEKKRIENDDPDPYVFEVVDGQQRIRTILEFMGVKAPGDAYFRGTWHEMFPTLNDTPIAKGKFYNQLNAEQQIKFDESCLTIMVLESAKIDEIRDMFLRLQNGTPLNAQQKRDAMGSSIGRVAHDLIDLDFFKRSVYFENTFSTHNLVASQMLHLELKGKIVSCTSPQLNKLYEQYKNIPLESSVISKTKKVLGVLGKIFPEKNQHLNQSYATTLYWLLSRILCTYEISETEFPKIQGNFVKMDIARLEAMTRDYSKKPEDEMYEDLSLAMSRGNNGSEGISTRHDIVGQFLFEDIFLKEKLNLDTKRNFTHEEKLILYHRAKGICQLEHNGKICGRKITFEDCVIDHILPHSKGGKTEIGNGRISYNLCNIAQGNKDTFDPEINCHFIEIQS
jgi:hypothetical protein